MPLNFDGEPVVFVPTPARLVDQSLVDPLNIQGHRDLMKIRRDGLERLAREIDDNLVPDKNLKVLEGIEVLLMSRESARRGVEKQLGTILSERFFGVDGRSRMVATRELSESSYWHLENIGVKAAEAPNAGKGILVGIADSWLYKHDGIDSRRELARAGFDSDGNLIEPVEVPSKHGTAITSLILGDVGIAQGCDFVFASVLTNTATTPCSGDPVKVTAGLSWLVNELFQTTRKVRVINASLDVKQTQEVAHIVASAWRAQVLIIGASGNWGTGSPIACPAIINDAVAGGALRRNDTAWSLTSVSKTKPEVWAPGDNVTVANTLNGYTLASGTSVAAALLTGGAARILGDQPKLDVKELREALLARVVMVDKANGSKKKLWFGP